MRSKQNKTEIMNELTFKLTPQFQGKQIDSQLNNNNNNKQNSKKKIK